MFRKLGKSKIAFILAILFGISLFFFRGGSRYSNLFNSDNIIAKVSGTPISTSKFTRSMQININQFSQMLGKQLTSQEIKNFQIYSIALSNLINSAVFENEFHSKNFIIDETVIAQQTKTKLPNLYNKNKLNELALNTFLKQQGLKIDDLVSIIDYETRAKTFDKYFFDINFPQDLNKKIIFYENHSRNINLIQLSIDNINLENSNEIITEENIDLKNYYTNNINNYKSKEKRNASYIVVNKNQFIEYFQPNEQEVKLYYESNNDLFVTKEKRNFVQFNFKTEKEANDFKNNINEINYKDIIEYAKENKIIYNEFENLTESEVLDDLSNVIFNLKIGEISNVVKTTIANHVIIVNAISPKGKKSYNESKLEISDTLLNIELDNFVSDLKNTISQQILNGLSLEEIANKNSLTIKKLEKIEKDYFAEEKDLIYRELSNQVFLSNIDYVSDLIEFDENRFFLFNVEEIFSSKILPLKEILEEVTIDWKKFKKIELIKDIYEKKLDLNNLNNNIKKYTPSITKLEIKNNNTDYPKFFVNEIFKTEVNDYVFYNNENKIFIAKIEKVNIPNNIENLNNKSISLLALLKNSFGNEIMKNKKITTNDALIDAIINQY
ncbi:MAG: hypothetical protein CMI96_03085 [Pelagibacteraceae bacterium]|nr:hypothetical protein [Pelagibacteraceae bacterium]|tara:strand:- start:1071 stop:2903 length:1833 start_codon:yes stop_codon:yes gene_type:complete